MSTSSPFDFLQDKPQTQPTGAQPSAPVSASIPPVSPGQPGQFDFLSTQTASAPSSLGEADSGEPRSILQHDESDRFTQENPDDNWLQKSWSFLNKPLTETLFGWGQYRQGAGGFERGVEKVASGLTAPLSLGMLAAFAPAGIAESVAGTTLKEGLTEGGTLLGEEALDGLAAAQKVERYGQAVEAAKKAQIAGGSIESAVSQHLPYQDFLNMGQYLRNQGMKETDVLGESFARRAASQGLRKAGVDSAQALNIAKGAETLVNAGFGVQQLHGAIYAYPKVMDLMGKGDYDDAAEYMVEAGAGTIFGGLGVAHGLTSIHDILPGVNEKENLPLSEEVENIKKVFNYMAGDIESDQAAIAARGRAHLADIMEAAGVPVPAGLRERVEFTPEEDFDLKALKALDPENLSKEQVKELSDLQAKKTLSETRADQTSLGAEISSAIQGILTNKGQREALLQKQKEFFVRLDSGNDRNAMYQKAIALREGYNLHEWFKGEAEKNGWNFVKPERTLEDIANEEVNGVLAKKVEASAGRDRLSSLTQDLTLATSDLRSAVPEDAPEIQKRIDDIKNQINQAKLAQIPLDAAYDRAKIWEDPERRAEAFRNLYEEHLQDLREAAKDVPWDSPTAKEVFREKVRALGNFPQDLSLIENEYPHFKEGAQPQATASSYINSPESYENKLMDPELVQKSISVNTPHGEAIAVPVGNNRISGSLDYVYSPNERNIAERAVDTLRIWNEEHPEEEGFPEPRVVKTGRDSLEVHWGEDVNKPMSHEAASYFLTNEHRRATEKVEKTEIKEESEREALDEIRHEIKYHQKALDNYPSGSANSLLAAQKVIQLKQEEPYYVTRHEYAADALEDSKQALERSKNRLDQINKGTVPEDLKLAPQDRAELLGEMYGYKASAVREFADQYKNFFAGPNVEAAKAFTRTQKFKNWFRNSRVVDENNDPMVVFHGTSKDWDTFDPRKAVSGGSLGFHAGSLSQAQDFVREGGSMKKGKFTREGGKIMPIFLSIQNPLRVPDLGTWRPEKVVANLASLGVKDDKPILETDRPKIMNRSEWANSNDAQKRMFAYAYNRIAAEIEDGKYKDGEKYADKLEQLKNDYVVNLLEDHGYDGLVYKNVAEGTLTSTPEKTGESTSGDSYIALHPNQIKSAVGNKGEFSPENESILEHKIHDTAPDPNEIKNVEDQIKKLSTSSAPGSDKQYQNLLTKLERLRGLDMGEVHQLPDGTKVAYLSRSGFRRLEKLLGNDRVPAGTVLSEGAVQAVRNGLAKAKYNPEQIKALSSIVEKSVNSNGTMVIAAADTGTHFDLADRLWTIREELIHHWQYSIGKSWIRHVGKAAESLRKTMPQEMVQHLKDYGYGNVPIYMKVTEAAAKLMATPPEQTMLPRAEFLEYDKLNKARRRGETLSISDTQKLSDYDNKVSVLRAKANDWLKQYFQAIKDQHGDKAFDSMVHVTTQARKWNEAFRRTYGSGPKPNEEAVGGVEPRPGEGATEPVGAGGGGAKPPTPPEPPPSADENFDWRKFFGPESGGILGDLFPTEAWQTGPQHPSLPADLVERVNKAKLRNHDAEQVEYVKSMIRAYMNGAQGISDKDAQIYNRLRSAEDDNWTAGYNNGIIHSIVPNHIHHMWGDDPKKGYPAETEARSGSFAINATQARHRAWATAFEGILAGRKLAVHDPSSLIAHDASEIAVTSGHRKALETLSKGKRNSDGSYETLKDPEGMPAFVFRGMGRVVPSEDGTKASILVNPNVVKNILMNPADIRRLTQSGLLDTYLRDGRVKDLTPQVGQGNVKEWLLATQKKLQKLGEVNPLLSSVAERKIHEEGWRQSQDFSINQAKKISKYLDESLDEIESGPIDAKGNYKALPEENKPDDINLAKYLGSVLHGKNGRITPADMLRLQEYADRNRNYAEGLASNGQGPIRPHEVARLIMQEKEHMSPELQEYIDKHHDMFGQRDETGNWSKKGVNAAIYHIAHAATNPEFPQLIQDLQALKQVDNMYTSINPISQALHKEEAMKLLKEINERQPKQYVWAPKSHIPIDHPSFHGYKWMASAADGTPTLAESDMAVSRHFYPYVINRLGLKPSWLRQKEGMGKITEPLLRTGAQVKSTILSGSPFHVIQIALRGLMLHVNPFVRPNPVSDLNEPFEFAPGKTSTLRKGVENSLTLFTDKNAAEDHSVGVASHGGLVSKIPIYGPFTDQIHDFLFNRFIPSVKVDAYKQMFKQYADAHPDWSEDAIAHRAAQHTNNAFGGINWREMGRSSTTQDWFNLVALAPDWLESEMRFASGLFNGYGIGPGKYQRQEGKNFTRIQVAQAAVVLWTTARLLNQLYSGSPHYESPFGLIVKDKDGRDIEYSVRTMPTDILHAATDPYGFLVGRTSPLLRTSQELVTGRNQYGQKLSDSEKYVDLLSNLSPIWGQAGFKKVTNLSTAADVGGVQQAVKAAGGTAQVYRTPAEKTAANLASERSEGGPVNPAQIARHRLLIQLEENVRSGKITNQDLETMVDQGQLPIADAKNVIKIAKETTGLDPEQARLYSRTSRLDLQGAFAVYDDANPSEKAFLHDLVVKKAKSYIKKSLKDETAATRSVDPVFKRARQYAPIVPETETVEQ